MLKRRVSSTRRRRLTSADLGGDSVSQGAALSQLLSEALTHVEVDVVGPQQLLEGFGGVAQVLGEDAADAPPVPQALAEVGQFSGLSLNQGVEFTGKQERGHLFKEGKKVVTLRE